MMYKRKYSTTKTEGVRQSIDVSQSSQSIIIELTTLEITGTGRVRVVFTMDTTQSVVVSESKEPRRFPEEDVVKVVDVRTVSQETSQHIQSYRIYGQRLVTMFRYRTFFTPSHHFQSNTRHPGFIQYLSHFKSILFFVCFFRRRFGEQFCQFYHEEWVVGLTKGPLLVFSYTYTLCPLYV